MIKFNEEVARQIMLDAAAALQRFEETGLDVSDIPKDAKCGTCRWGWDGWGKLLPATFLCSGICKCRSPEVRILDRADFDHSQQPDLCDRKSIWPIVGSLDPACGDWEARLE